MLDLNPQRFVDIKFLDAELPRKSVGCCCFFSPSGVFDLSKIPQRGYG